MGESVKRGLLVLGMHRSGTSALTRTLSLLGAELPRTLIPAHPSNVTGHWESRDLAAVHEELLAAAGSSWRDFRPLDQGWLRSPPAAPFRARLAAILARDLGGSLFLVV